MTSAADDLSSEGVAVGVVALRVDQESEKETNTFLLYFKSLTYFSDMFIVTVRPVTESKIVERTRNVLETPQALKHNQNNNIHTEYTWEKKLPRPFYTCRLKQKQCLVIMTARRNRLYSMLILL